MTDRNHGNSASVGGAVHTNLKAFDTKKVRIRAVGSEVEAYERYFRKSIAKNVSMIQIVLGVFIIIAHITNTSIKRSDNGLDAIGCGIWIPLTTLIAVGFTFFSIRKPSYCKLHLAMAFHIMSTLFFIFFEILAFSESIPRLKRDLFNAYYEQDRQENLGNGNEYEKGEFNETEGIDNEPRDYRYNKRYGSRSYYYYDSDSKDILMFSLVLTSLMSFAGLAQLCLSLFMSCMTGKAVCCGQSHMDGRVFEFDVGASENSGFVFDQTAVGGKKTDVVEGAEGPTSPPPYESGVFNIENLLNGRN